MKFTQATDRFGSDCDTATFVQVNRSLASFACWMLALLIGFYAVVLLFGVTKSIWECEGTHFASAGLGAE